MKNTLNLDILTQNYHAFSAAFGGDVYYAVKANPLEGVIIALSEAGIAGFDVASLSEIKNVRNLVKDAPLLYTHPIKTKSDICAAYSGHKIRRFVVDCHSELLKLSKLLPSIEVEVLIRVKVPIFGTTAMQDLDQKFGVVPSLANALIQEAKRLGFKIGICFHVGSQQKTPNAHLQAIKFLMSALDTSRFKVSTLSIGGGFPASYTLGEPTEFRGVIPSVDSIRANFSSLGNTHIIAEPGRCLVADATYSEVTVIGVDGTRLFIDDGVYGGLMDCGIARMRFSISNKSITASRILSEFTVFGPTCDALDVLPDTYLLSSDTKEGDALIIHNTGAYGSGLAENFNGLAPPSVTNVIRPSKEGN